MRLRSDLHLKKIFNIFFNKKVYLFILNLQKENEKKSVIDFIFFLLNLKLIDQL